MTVEEEEKKTQVKEEEKRRGEILDKFSPTAALKYSKGKMQRNVLREISLQSPLTR